MLIKLLIKKGFLVAGHHVTSLVGLGFQGLKVATGFSASPHDEDQNPEEGESD
tara:strand:+ start:861 stop:1019 length:159 start_codon:yes stop_codon:yes gene_type:complete